MKRKTTWDARWDRHRVQAALSVLMGEERAEIAAFGRVDGRWDLRGLPLDQEWLRGPFEPRPPGTLMQSGWKRLKIDRPAWTDLDLSHGRMSSLEWENGTITNCRFEAAHMPMTAFWGVEVHNCSFHGAYLYNGTLHGSYAPRFRKPRLNTFTDTDFSGADLRWSYARGEFRRCDFSRAKFNGDWWQSAQNAAFRECRFGGRLRSPIFGAKGPDDRYPDPTRLDGTDFADAELEWPAFRGLNLHGVRWPEDDKHVVVRHPRPTLEAALEVLDEAGSKEATEVAAQLRRRQADLGPAQETLIFHHAEFTQYAGPGGLPLARRVLADAEGSLGTPFEES